MSSSIRKLVQRKVARSLQSTKTSEALDSLSSLHLRHDANGRTFAFILPLKSKDSDVHNAAEIIAKDSCDVFPRISLETDGSHPSIAFAVPRDNLIAEILRSNIDGPAAPPFRSKKLKAIVEFSSPNIAKPFHVGHLRSTIIGNYVANLHGYLDDAVRKINYLGDWGTQVGYVQLGIDSLDLSEEAIRLNPMGELYRAYVHANKLAETDPSVGKRACEIFERLEKGDTANSEQWKILRKYTRNELKMTYERLGVHFDEYHWESMYGSRKIAKIVERMEKMNLLRRDAENRKVVAANGNRSIPVIKSDGSTLYITRDVAAAIDRFEKYNFDVMYYVVDNSQFQHFANLTTILRKMEMPWADRLRHVKFGKIRGMSTRKGTAVFLKDFLDEARDAMRGKQTRTPTTKVSLDMDDTSSDSLGMAAVIIHDLKQKRQRDYEFDWKVALDIKGETGVKLQYTHCRLVSLEENSGASLPTECDPSLLREVAVDTLVAKIIRFDEAVISSYQTLEPCYLARYLFELTHIINKTLNELRVKDEPNHVASQRLLLYGAAKNVLAKGMRLLGLRPLDKM